MGHDLCLLAANPRNGTAHIGGDLLPAAMARQNTRLETAPHRSRTDRTPNPHHRPIDVTPAEMNARRKQQQRIANTKYRRRKGAKLRAEYLRETQGKPWLELGISRATYYRKRKTP